MANGNETLTNHEEASDFVAYMATVDRAPEFYTLASFDGKTGKLITKETSESCVVGMEDASPDGWMVQQTYDIHGGLMPMCEVYVGRLTTGRVAKIFSKSEITSPGAGRVIRHHFEDEYGIVYLLDIHNYRREEERYDVEYSVSVEDLETFVESLEIAENRQQGIEFYARFIEMCLNRRYIDTTITSYKILQELGAI